VVTNREQHGGEAVQGRVDRREDPVVNLQD
jgi:hypothetical protein